MGICGALEKIMFDITIKSHEIKKMRFILIVDILQNDIYVERVVF